MFLKSVIAGLCLWSLTQTTLASEVAINFKFSDPDIDTGALLSKKSDIDFTSIFSAINSTVRGSGGSIYKTVSPSVVKVLTNEGSGSGVVLSKTGVILTNYHVIEGYSSVGVVFVTDKENDKVKIAEVFRVNQIADLALLKLPKDTPGLSPIKPAKKRPEVGDDVHAIGHPLGEDWTYTRGYISQMRKDYTWQTSVTDHHLADIIQTQTPINPGNSGGPLLNDQGELIGINSFVNTKAEGLNYAVDLTTVSQFLNNKENVIRQIVSLDQEHLLNTADRNKNGNPDLYVWDKNLNKVGDMLGIDADEDLAIELIFLDKNENGKPEVTIKPSDIPDVPGILYLFDKDEDGKNEALGVDTDRDGQIDEIVQLN